MPKTRKKRKTTRQKQKIAENGFYGHNDIVELHEHCSNPEAVLQEKEEMTLLEKATGKSSNLKFRLKLLKLYYIEGYVASDIAKQLGISETKVKAYLVSSIDVFKRRLGLIDSK